MKSPNKQHKALVKGIIEVVIPGIISNGVDGYIVMSIFMLVAIRTSKVDFKNML